MGVPTFPNLQSMAAGAIPVWQAPSPVGGGPTSYSSAAVEASHVIKAAAGVLYGAYCWSSVAGFLLTFNSLTVPSAGAVTPVAAVPLGAGGFAAFDFSTFGDDYATGICVGFSTGANPWTFTPSATAFFKVRYA